MSESNRVRLEFEHEGQVERIYLQDLMNAPDAVEGIRVFLDKRPPSWTRSGAIA